MLLPIIAGVIYYLYRLPRLLKKHGDIPYAACKWRAIGEATLIIVALGLIVG